MIRKMFLLKAVVTVLLLLMPGVVTADQPEARRIMEKVEAVDDGDNRTADMLMILTDKKGAKRKKYFKTFSKEYGEDSKQLMIIDRPANIRNSGFLTFDYDNPDQDDDQWLYLPSLGRPKRIATGDKDGSFMGSDLNYSDMASRELEDYDYRILKEMTLKDEKVWLIESLPRSEKVIDETGYRKLILAVRQDIYLVSRIKAWPAKGNYVKITDFSNLEEVDGILVHKDVRVIKKAGKSITHKTQLLLSDIKFNQDLSDDFFTLRRLEKGL
ncbi:MAG: outer membrane lipoprotein-sorting protein [Desulfobacteraceae bacterium]|nr:outer membrane lipoprotein-sorting protein [Desulfobacteraceae bacterium]